MVEAPAPVVLRPIGRAIAPPGETALRRGHKSPSDVDPIVGALKPAQRLHLDRRMADHGQKRLVTPNVALERRYVEIADDDCRLFQVFRPPCHTLDEVELLA